MMAILDKQQLTGEQLKKKHEVIKILGEFLRKPNSEGLVVPTWDREMTERGEGYDSYGKSYDKGFKLNDNGFSWLGWTVINGTANDVAALVRSKQPFDPLLGKL